MGKCTYRRRHASKPHTASFGYPETVVEVGNRGRKYPSTKVHIFTSRQEVLVVHESATGDRLQEPGGKVEDSEIAALLVYHHHSTVHDYQLHIELSLLSTLTDTPFARGSNMTVYSGIAEETLTNNQHWHRKRYEMRVTCASVDGYRYPRVTPSGGTTGITNEGGLYEPREHITYMTAAWIHCLELPYLLRGKFATDDSASDAHHTKSSIPGWNRNIYTLRVLTNASTKA
ncbi:hypothetical protein BC629DRAFT_1440727 [Irpex lacteus]|nr:hypothetical protein BC629DRAFT_1440727 [Irpex lacteus]